MIYTRGIDVSTFQDSSETPQRIDWTKPGPAGYKFVVNRLVMGTGIDQDFVFNYLMQAQVGLIRGGYGFWDYRAGAPGSSEQGRAFGLVERDYPSEMPVIWCDYERPGPLWPALPPRLTCLEMMKAYKEAAEDASGKQAGAYMNTAMIMYLMNNAGSTVDLPDWLRSMPLWIAAWPTVPEVYTLEDYIRTFGWLPNLRGQWEKFTLWQYGTPARGHELGMESGDIDVDYYNGSEIELRAWCSLAQPEPEPPPTTGGNVYEGSAILLETNKPGWTNPGFAAIIARAGEGDETPNPDLKAIEDQAAAEGKPFACLYDLNVRYYTYNQYPMEESRWPPLAEDLPFNMFTRALANRAPRAVFIRVMDSLDWHGKDAAPAWINFVARVFIGKAAKWLAANKPGVKLYLATNHDWAAQYAPALLNWAHQYPTMVVQPGAIDRTNSLPTGKPGYIGNSSGWKFWTYYDIRSGAREGDSLVLFNGSPAALVAEIGTVTQPPTQPPPTTETPTLAQLAARLLVVETELEKLRARQAAAGQALTGE